MKRIRHAGALWGCLVLAMAAGCTGTAPRKEIEFDKNGWGGPNLTYVSPPLGNVIKVGSGVLINKDFRWADSEFSFEFLDNRDLIWGVVLLDSVFRPARRADLLGERKWIRASLSGEEYVQGKDLAPSDYWRLWKFDRVMELGFVPDRKGLAYKVLVAWWYPRILDDEVRATRSTGVHRVQLNRNDWNTFSARITGGKFTYALNGRPGAPFDLDPRLNGRLGIFLDKGGPLLLRSLTLGRKPAGGTPEPHAHQ